MKGVLFVNLGSPDSTDPKDVKRYLDEFLMDKRVFDFPYWLRSFIVKGIILNTRPKKSAEAYEKIWWDEGSPLIVLSERLKTAVGALTSVPIALGMRYGNPSLKSGLEALREKGVTEVLLVPLYPQFAMATTETILVLAEELRARYFPEMEFINMPSFYNHPDYIRVLSESIQRELQTKNWDHLLFSYHGLPERHIKKSDITQSHCKIDGSCCQTASEAHKYCYRHQCYETTKLVAAYLGLKQGSYSTSFQSRLGIDPWLKPATNKTINKMPENGIKNLAVVTPAFVSDCIETLEEIGIQAKEEFIAQGGEQLHLVPCLNEDDAWVKVLARWVDQWATVTQNA